MTINDPRDDPKYRVGGSNYKAQFETAESGVDAKTVNDFHRKSDVDSSQEAQHHTLGVKQDQASPGGHKHDGTNSLKILTGTNITGAKTAPASGSAPALASVIAALVKLGATDTTTP